VTNHPPYVELRARSAFSFLEGASAPEDLVDCAAALGYDAIALGDRDGLYGAPRFYQAATSGGIKAIVGAEVTLEAGFGDEDPHPPRNSVQTQLADSPARLRSAPPSGLRGRPLRRGEASDSRLYLIAPDRERYRNLCRMITASKLRVIGENPGWAAESATRGPDRSLRYPAKGESRITLADLERFGHGMIALGGGARSPLARKLTRGDDPTVLCDRLGAIFGRGNFYIDLQRHLDPDEERLNRKLIALADRCGIPTVATNDVCFTTPVDSNRDPQTSAASPDSERALLDVLTCIRLGTTLEEAGRRLWINHERQLKAPAAMAALFRDMPTAIAATRTLADRCAFTLKDLGYRFPDYPLPPGETPDSYLRALTTAGARERWGAPDERTRRQLEHELDIIARLKLAGYFLIVWDIVQFCRENRIMAQGRGSAANSAVCYALGITAVDAVKMELLFERFLSEERGEWPDIDIDLPSGDQRESVIQYVYRRYGERGAAMTANVITYRTRSAIRETGKVLGFPPDQVDRLARLNYVYEFQDQHDEFTALLRKGGVDPDAPRIRMLTGIVKRLQGLPRHLGQHSGGMVIGAGPLDEIVPLEPATMPGRVVVQWDKDDCADLGIIKIDLLGLGMLAVLEEAIPLVRAHEGVAVDLAHLPPDDPEVYAMLQKADTIGVFQVESRAQMATLPRMKPRTFYDLVVEVAIIRPGPIVGKMVHPYLDRRAGRAKVIYDHPSLEPILRRTLGVPLFQEQLLRMAMTVAGFSGGEAEELRRAMGFKRSTARMQKLEQRLRDGMARNGIHDATADRIIHSITSFALYGFPESHSASFALIAYASAYLKCHHPAAFYAAMLNCYPLGFYNPATLLKDAKRHGVEVLPIDVLRSDWKCTIETSKGASPRLGEAVEHLLRDGEGPLSGDQNSEVLSIDPHPRIGASRPMLRPLPVEGEGSRDERLQNGAASDDSKPRNALRLGLNYIAGLHEETGLRIERARVERSFDSIADFTARVAPRRRELDAIAYAGAFAALGMTRREALWQAAAVERDPASLLNGAQPSHDESTEANLPGMAPVEETLADYAASGVTVGPHLMAHLRARLTARGVLSAAALEQAANGVWVKCAGVVIVRQRPGTASGFMFLTLEDETGIANAIVTPDQFQANRTVLHRAQILMVEGPLQKQDGVIHIRGRRFTEVKMAGAMPPSHDFR
jgi:error-prone DNA polymerase